MNGIDWFKAAVWAAIVVGLVAFWAGVTAIVWRVLG